MTNFFTSDTHFGHANIIKYTNRPFTDVPAMNEALIANWNAVVSPYDTVFHMGDVALGPWVEWDSVLSRLNGNIFLVIGNHDRVFEGMGQKQNDKFRDVYAQWFAAMKPSVTGYILGAHVINMSHFPYDGDHTSEERYNEYRLPDEGRVLLHGHTHYDSKVSRSKKGTLQIHVGQDAWDYRPVSEAEVLDLIRENS